jgi:hypothetical protein
MASQLLTMAVIVIAVTAMVIVFGIMMIIINGIMTISFHSISGSLHAIKNWRGDVIRKILG